MQILNKRKGLAGTAVAVVILVVGLLALGACSRRDPIIGVWGEMEDGFAIEFARGGLLASTNNRGEVITNSWERIDSSRIVIYSEDGNRDIAAVSISGNVMEMRIAGSRPMTFIRQSR